MITDRTLRENLSYPAYCEAVDAIGRGESLYIERDMFGTTIYSRSGTHYHEPSPLALYYDNTKEVDIDQVIEDIIGGNKVD